MRSGGQTTVIQRILEKRAQKPPEIQEDTSATIAVMLRVLPPPRALLVFEDAVLLDHIESTIAADVLDGEADHSRAFLEAEAAASSRASTASM